MSRYKSPAFGSSPIFGRSKPSVSATAGDATFVDRIVAFLMDCVETYRQRRALAALDDHMLKDIGLTRCDVEAEVSRPFWR